MKKEIVYTLPYSTDEDKQKAEELRSELYVEFDEVTLYSNGLHEVRIVCNDEGNSTIHASASKAYEQGVADALKEVDGAGLVDSSELTHIFLNNPYKKHD